MVIHLHKMTPLVTAMATKGKHTIYGPEALEIIWNLILLCRFRCVFSELAMPWDWPVEVNYHEAKAFCRWKGDHFRLATEAEHAAMGDMPVRGGTARDIMVCSNHLCH